MPSVSRSRVLVVDDNEISRDLLAQVLQTGGFDVIATSSGERALLTLCRQGDEIDWLVSKLKLPGLVCGRLLADEYRGHHAGRPVLLLEDMINATERSSANTVFVSPAAPLRVLELLKALREPEPARVLPFPVAEAA